MYFREGKNMAIEMTLNQGRLVHFFVMKCPNLLQLFLFLIAWPFFLSNIKIEVKRCVLWSALLGPSNMRRAWAVLDRNSRGREPLPPQESSAEMFHFLSLRGTYGIV